MVSDVPHTGRYQGNERGVQQAYEVRTKGCVSNARFVLIMINGRHALQHMKGPQCEG